MLLLIQMVPLLLLMYFSHFDIIIYVHWFPSSFADIVFVINLLFRMWWFSLSFLTTPCSAANIITRYILIFILFEEICYFCLCFTERIEWMKTFSLDWTIWPPERRLQLAHCSLSRINNANDWGCHLQHCSSQNVVREIEILELEKSCLGSLRALADLRLAPGVPRAHLGLWRRLLLVDLGPPG